MQVTDPSGQWVSTGVKKTPQELYYLELKSVASLQCSVTTVSDITVTDHSGLRVRWITWT